MPVSSRFEYTCGPFFFLLDDTLMYAALRFGFPLIGLGMMLGALSNPATADELYIGAGAYLTDIELSVADEDDVTPAGFIGYQFLDSNFLMLAAEVGYYDLGASRGEVQDISFSADASALTLAGVVYVPVGPFIEVYAKAGAGRIEVNTRVGDERRNEDGTEFFGGVGVSWDFFDTVDIYAEYLQFDNAVNSSMFGVGVRLDFF